MRVQESEALPPPAPGVAGRRGIPHGAEAPTDPFGRASMPRTARKSPTERCRGQSLRKLRRAPSGPSHAPPPSCAGGIVAGPGAPDVRNRGSHAVPAGRQDGGAPSNRGRAVTRSQRGMPLRAPWTPVAVCRGFAAPLTIHGHASGRRRVGSPWRTRCCAETRLPRSASRRGGAGFLDLQSTGTRRVGAGWGARGEPAVAPRPGCTRSASRGGRAGFLDKARSLPRYGAAAGRRRRAVRRPRGQGVARASSRHGRPRGQRGLRGMRRRSNAAAFLPRASEHRSRFEPR